MANMYICKRCVAFCTASFAQEVNGRCPDCKSKLEETSISVERYGAMSPEAKTEAGEAISGKSVPTHKTRQETRNEAHTKEAPGLLSEGTLTIVFLWMAVGVGLFFGIADKSFGNAILVVAGLIFLGMLCSTYSTLRMIYNELVKLNSKK